jgi:hypothetical protein
MKTALFLVTTLTLGTAFAEGGPSTPPAAAVSAPASATMDAGSARKTSMVSGLPAELADRLSPDQLTQIALEHERTRQKQEHGIAGEMVPIVMFICIVLAIALSLFLGNIRDANRQKTIQAMVEKGVTVPPELLGKPSRPATDLRKGLVTIAVGLGIAAFFAVFTVGGMPAGLWSLGLIPFFIGVGYLAAYKIESRRDGSR